jgi:hypothetical protein
VLPGEEVVFGRGVHDVGELPNNTLVSHRHGVIAATESGFSVTSIGTYSGFVVRDTMTPSRLHLPQGMGPIELPFANAIISFDHGVPGRIEVAVVGSDRADLWEQRWGPEEQHDEEVELHDRQRRWRTTRPRGLKRKARGEPYTWFWTLVAMCEGEITSESAGVPTNAELGRRLGYDTNIIERHLSSIYEALDIDPHEQQRPRDTAVRRAVDRGLVTREQLQGLHERTIRSTGDD